MKIIYMGGLAEGTLKDPETGAVYEFKRSQAIEVSDKFGQVALQNPEWKSTAASKEKASEK